MEKKTEVNQIEITQDGTIQIRLALKIVDGAQELHSQWHRTSCNPGTDVDAQFALVNAHLAALSYPAVPVSDIDRVKAQANAAWTPSIVSAFMEKIALLGASA